MGTSRYTDAVDLEAELERWHNFGECLLVDFGLTHHGYSVRLEFNFIWETYGRIRPDLGAREHLVVIELHGVQSLHLTGALSQQMLQHPEEINWGLSEVAVVRAEPRAHGIQLSVLWEGERRILVEAQSAEVTPAVAGGD